MKRFVLIVLVILYAVCVKAQQNDTTIYNGCEGEASRFNHSVVEPAVYADKCPAFIGGMAQLFGYLASNIKLNTPPKQVDNFVLPGRMSIEFIVEKDGSIKNVKIIRGNNEEINKEVITLLKKSPK